MTKEISSFDEQSRDRAGKPFFLNLILLPLLILLVLLLILLAAPRSSRAEDAAAAGRIAAIDSGPKAAVINVLRPARKGFEKAKTGDNFFPGDTLKTGTEIRVKLEMADGSVISMAAESTMCIKAHSVNQDEAVRNSVFKLLKGIVRFVISRTANNKDWKESTVVVETPTAVAGVRGTDFFTSVHADKNTPETEIAVLEGVVSARNVNLAIKGSVSVNADTLTIVPRKAGPTRLPAFSEEHKARLIEATTVRASGTPAKPAAPTTGRYTEDDIARDVHDGVPLNQIIDRAVESRIGIDRVITALLEAGVPAYTAVYIAIEEGHSATGVVAAALTAGAPLTDVVTAAVIAGAETKTIIWGADMAGALPQAVAAAIAQAKMQPPPVYGMTLPTRDMPSPVDEVLSSSFSLPERAGGGPLPASAM